jgi:tetratricopeptide (TPR) repeat protein
VLWPELEIAEALAKRDAQNPIWQHDLSVSHDRIGDILDKKGDRKAALESFRKGLAIAKALTLRDADNLQWQWDLSVSHDRIGDLLIAEGRLEEALQSYRRGMQIAEALAKRDPGNAGWQRDLAVSYHKIGSLEAIGNPGEAASSWRRAAPSSPGWPASPPTGAVALRPLPVRRGAADADALRQGFPLPACVHAEHGFAMTRGLG